jgi:hypothetical protein
VEQTKDTLHSKSHGNIWPISNGGVVPLEAMSGVRKGSSQWKAVLPVYL